MFRRARLLLGVSIFWLALSMLLDGLNTLVLPTQLSGLVDQGTQATILGLLTFVGLLAGALVQPVAGALSDRWRPLFGRKWFIGIGLCLSVLSLILFAFTQNVVGMTISYLAIQISASFAQAGQQGLIPDLVSERQRGLASGLKGFMDITGAMLGFLILGQLLGSGSAVPAVVAMVGILIITYLIAIWLTPDDKPAREKVTKTNSVPLGRVFRLDCRQHANFIRLLVSRFLFLLGIYATGRFLLLFVADRLELPAGQAAEQAGALLAGLALITVLASPVTGWLADRVGRFILMLAGAALGAASALLLIGANHPGQILLFGGFMSLGSAAFSGGSWAALADFVPKDEPARFFGLANLSTAGSAAVAGLLGPVVDEVNRSFPGQGFSVLFMIAALAFLVSAFPIRNLLVKEVRDVREKYRNKRKDRADASGLAVLSLPADPATLEKDQNP